MKSIEATGKTVQEAVRNGCAMLSCGLDDVEYKVLEMGTPGLFGLFGKPAKILLTLKDGDPSMDIEMPKLSLNPESGRGEKRRPKPEAKKPEPKKPEPQKSEPAAESGEEPAADAAPQGEKKRRRRRRGRGHGAEGTESAPVEAQAAPEVELPPVEHEPFEPTPEDQLSDTAKGAAAFLKGLTDRMGVEMALEVQETEEQLRMQMSGENMSLLIGRRGETLDALQYLTSLNVNRGREDYLRVSIDTENYRAKREESLRKLAVRMAGRAKKTGRRVTLEPMNPYERRILHSALQNDPDVTTHSEGEEPYRHVIISLK